MIRSLLKALWIKIRLALRVARYGVPGVFIDMEEFFKKMGYSNDIPLLVASTVLAILNMYLYKQYQRHGQSYYLSLAECLDHCSTVFLDLGFEGLAEKRETINVYM